jgi:uncharacterized membrane protein YphA (DoxX/SURF4 family)
MTDTPMMLVTRSPSQRRARTVVYWTCTGAIAAEAFAGGVLDLVRYGPYLSALTNLGYPAYLATILGTAKVVAGAIVVAPRLPRLKEWAYAGILVNMLGAAASQAFAGSGPAVIPPLVLGAVALASWATRPADRRLPGPLL